MLGDGFFDVDVELLVSLLFDEGRIVGGEVFVVAFFVYFSGEISGCFGYFSGLLFNNISFNDVYESVFCFF